MIGFLTPVAVTASQRVTIADRGIAAQHGYSRMVKTVVDIGKFGALIVALLMASGCSENSSEQAGDQKAARATRITTFAAEMTDIEITEQSVGELESLVIPQIAAEVEGRIARVLVEIGDTVAAGQVLAELEITDYRIAEQAAQAEVAQLEVLRANQQRTVQRYQDLAAAKSISIDRLDEVTAQLDALEQQLKGAKARLAQSRRGVNKTAITSRFNGVVDQQLISPGDFVKVGAPLFRVANIDRLRVRLPLPETLAGQLARGLEIRLTSPFNPDVTITSQIQEIRPTVGLNNRAIDVVTQIDNPGNWRPGGSVTGVIVVGRRADTIVVPSQSVVLRPAGNVVYAISDNTAQQRVVEVGHHMGELVEIRSGISAGEVVAVNGAGFLTDGAPVSIAQPAAP